MTSGDFRWPYPLKWASNYMWSGPTARGKSALFQQWVTSVHGPTIKRIAAHRQTWFESGNLNFTARSRRDFEEKSMDWDRQSDARWMDHSPAEKQAAVLFDLVAKDNARYRTIGQHVDDNKRSVKRAHSPQRLHPFSSNSMIYLTWEHLTVSLSNSDDEEILARHRNSDISFSIAPDVGRRESGRDLYGGQCAYS